MPESHQGCLPGRYWGLGRYPDSSDRDLDTEIWMFRANRNFTRVPLHNAFTTLWFGKKKNKSRHQDKKDFNDLDVLLTSPGPLWLMMSIGAFGHFFAYTLSIYLLNVCLKFLLFATDWHRQATARDAESFYAPGLIIISRYRPPLPEDTISLLLAMVRCHEEDMEGTRRWIKEVVR